MFSLIFPGQGSQSVGMAKELHVKFDMVKKLFNEADNILDFSISSLILEGPKDQLDLTENTQPAIFLVGYSIFQLLKEVVLPTIIENLGHSHISLTSNLSTQTWSLNCSVKWSFRGSI